MLIVRCVEDLEAQQDFLLNKEQRDHRMSSILKSIDDLALCKPAQTTSTWGKLVDIGMNITTR